jgi:outer membrane protein OmpA-like peptidoglycan-associated protein
MNEMKRYLIATACLLLGNYSVAQKANYDSRTRLSDSVNVKEDESAALLSPDGKTLYFVRSFYSGNTGGASGKQDIYFSTKKAGDQWTNAKNLGLPLNDEFHNAVCGISADGNKLYLNAIRKSPLKSVPGVSVSTKMGNIWSPALPLTSFEFPEKGFFQVYVAPDESFIIVSFEGADSKGLEDLYVMKKDASGKFSDPVNMGSIINSSGFETSPVVSKDGKTLYFSSNGFGGQGDGDIFKTTRLDDSWTSWSKPENVGSKINTTGFDGSFSVDDEGNAYYVSGEGSSGPGDIFTISLIAPPPPPAPVEVEVPKVVEEPKPIAAPKPVSVDTLGQALFEFNSIVINPNSKESLKMVAKKLKKNKTYRIQVEGHTDEKGAEEYNQKLSEKRAASVKKFLVSKGIKSSTIITKGFGELNPVADNTTEEGMAKNRRVEVKYFIKKK